MKAIPPCLLNENTRGKGSAVLGPPNGACPKRNSHRDSHISSERDLVSRKKIQATSSMETADSVCSNRDEWKNRYIPGGRATFLAEKASGFPVLEKSSSDEFLRELDNLMHGFGELPSPMELREPHKNHEVSNFAHACLQPWYITEMVPINHHNMNNYISGLSDENSLVTTCCRSMGKLVIHLDLYLEATDSEEFSDLHLQMRTAPLGVQTTLQVTKSSFVLCTVQC
jgi:hypothetical protein